MTVPADLQPLLEEILGNQREMLALHQERLNIARRQLERSNMQIEESLQLQREAVAKQKLISRIALPAVILCIALLLYLVVKYF